MLFPKLVFLTVLFAALSSEAQLLGNSSFQNETPQIPQSALSTSLPNGQAPSSGLKSSYKLSLETGDYQDDLGNKGTYTSMSAQFAFVSSLSPFLDLRVLPSATFRSGHFQSASGATTSTSSMSLTEASATLHDHEWIEFEAGALNGRGYFSSALVDEDLAFPAARFSLQTGSRRSSFIALYAEAAVPTSTSLTANSGADENTPTFLVGGIRGQLKESGFTLKTRANYFEYQSLTQGIATDSGVIGNTVVSNNLTPSGQFQYQYYGYETGADLRFDPSRQWGAQIGGTAIENQGAPSGSDLALIGSGKIDIWAQGIKYSPTADYFKIDSDAAVSEYVAPEFQTNRIGYAGGLDIQYHQKFRVKLRGGERVAIVQSPTQGQESFVSVALETLNATF